MSPCPRACPHVPAYVALCCYTFALAFWRVPQEVLTPPQRCVTPSVCHCGGGCHHVPLTASRAQYKHAAADEFPDCMLPGSQTTSPSPFRPQTHRFLHSGGIEAYRGSRPTYLGHGISAHIPPQTGNPLSPTSVGSTLGWLMGKRGLSGTELSVCSVLGTPWFCPPADNTRCPPFSASPGQGNL